MCSAAQLCPTLCDPVDCSLPGSLHGISQARILEQVAISSSREINPGIKPTSPASPALASRFFTTAPSGKPPKGSHNNNKKKVKKLVNLVNLNIYSSGYLNPTRKEMYSNSYH